MKRDVMTGTHFGAPVARKEDAALVTGTGCYVDDIQIPGLLHAFILRSPIPHGRIRAIDLARAQSAPGVVAAFAFDELPDCLKIKPMPLVVPNPAIRHPITQYALADREVHYVGEPVAVVVALARSLAEDAAELVDIEYETLPAVASLDQARGAGAPRAHLGIESNLAGEALFADGDCNAAFARAHKVIKASFDQHRGGAFFMETRGCVAVPSSVGKSFTLYGAMQAPHRIKRILQELFGLADDELRVVAPSDVGGGFGPKGSFYPEYALITHCVQLLGRPVKWIEDRRENFVATHQERDQKWDLELAVDQEGRILGLRGQLAHDTGAYVPWGLVLPWISMTTLQGPYVVPTFALTLKSFFTNKVPTTPVRGAGRPQAVFAMERLMDRVAQELGLDRSEVRRRNFIRPEQMPFNCRVIGRDGSPVLYDSGDYPGTQALALQNGDWAGFPARQTAARAQGRYLGIGLANFVEATGLGPYEGATVKIGTNGSIVVYTGAAPQGQSHHTTLAQIAADQLGVAPAAVKIVTGDTQGISLGIGTFAARSAVNAGNAVHMACSAVRHKIQALAAKALEANPGQIVLADGMVSVDGAPDRSISLARLAVVGVGMPGYSLDEGMTPGLEHTSYFSPAQSTFSNGCHVVEVEVDPEIGAVKLLRYVVVDDCGRQINPMVVHGQVVGGVVHGIGNALLEELVYDESGQLLSCNFGEYLLPLASDITEIEVLHTETPSPLNPLGVKGAGEGGTLPVTAAIASAIEDALKPFDVTISQVPITPMRLVEKLKVAGAR
ncbi:molybdopterin cofactor-binding domain-containing protein [Paraburkholderia sp. BR13439]|uniref:molybdopterin cofactor-binding domain-containing protein n=1 Tax=Paraburkholderia sp. BR13439 TaxID=3236996 RepID=UPI0034CE9BB7